MFITDLIEKPIASFRFLNAARRGGVPNVERIGVMHAHTTGIPEELDAIIATADLQDWNIGKQPMGSLLD